MAQLDSLPAVVALVIPCTAFVVILLDRWLAISYHKHVSTPDLRPEQSPDLQLGSPQGLPPVSAVQLGGPDTGDTRACNWRSEDELATELQRKTYHLESVHLEGGIEAAVCCTGLFTARRLWREFYQSNLDAISQQRAPRLSSERMRVSIHSSRFMVPLLRGETSQPRIWLSDAAYKLGISLLGYTLPLAIALAAYAGDPYHPLTSVSEYALSSFGFCATVSLLASPLVGYRGTNIAWMMICFASAGFLWTFIPGVMAFKGAGDIATKRRAWFAWAPVSVLITGVLLIPTVLWMVGGPLRYALP